jgi:TfoX/Sxy family transcriptional regulator of competence genes
VSGNEDRTTDKKIVDAEFIHDLFQPFGAVTVRRMFGGAGLFADGVMFGLVSGGQILPQGRCNDGDLL